MMFLASWEWQSHTDVSETPEIMDFYFEFKEGCTDLSLL